MKKTSVIALALAIMFVGSGLFAGSAEAAVRVRSYIRKSTHTFVLPHYRSSPNHTRLDNWSSKGNFNPYTGKVGTKSIFWGR
jgi:hypothetical protein